MRAASAMGMRMGNRKFHLQKKLLIDHINKQVLNSTQLVPSGGEETNLASRKNFAAT